MPLNLPNALTVARIASIPFLIAAYLLLSGELRQITTTTIFVVAALTDLLDGYLARKLELVSPFGAFLDPIADKLMICTALVLLVSDSLVLDQTLLQGFFILSAIVIVGREVSVVALREWMAELGSHTKIPSNWLGKVKTTVQMAAIILLLFGQTADTPIGEIHCFRAGELLLYAAAVLTLWSMTIYMRTAWPLLRSDYIDYDD